MNRIARFGVELEGGFTSEIYEKAKILDRWHSDGSVNVSGVAADGECVSEPHSKIEDLKKWIKSYYPQKVNQTCGYHIHISTKTRLDYSRLMCKTFHRHFIKKWEQWGEKNVRDKKHHFWLRLGGVILPGSSKNYCKRQFVDPMRQFNDGDRYHQLNFCWGRHRTLENRMLPMFDNPSLACNALEYYVNFVERWLTLQPKSNLIESGVVEVPCVTRQQNESVDIDMSEEIESEVLCV